MLEILKIKNIAIIDCAEIHFKKGLNILSGETGAGKSIVIEAISLLLGSRASIELIRGGCDEATIEGLFNLVEIPWVMTRLQHAGFNSSVAELLIKRIVHRGGRHRIFINGELATLSILQNICEGLIDLCGQHEHQSLLRTPVQLELLDRYGKLTDQSREATEMVTRLNALRKEQVQLQRDEENRATQLDFLQFQIDEISRAQLEPTEDENLPREKQLLQSARGRVQVAEVALNLLDNPDGIHNGDHENIDDARNPGNGALPALRTALQKLKTLVSLDPRGQPLVESLERSVAEAEEVSLSLLHYIKTEELDPQRLQNVQDRLSLIANLRRKYGLTIPDILNTLARIQDELASVGQTSERLALILADLGTLEIQFSTAAQALLDARRKVSNLLGKSVTQELKDLNMNEACFSVALPSGQPLQASDIDQVQFMIQTNLGEPARPIGKIASGGELSRLMLAIRRVIADRGGIGVYLFDEIDAGIGGQTAFQVGKKLKSVSRYHQIICITHLPQVAAFAENHWIVQKSIYQSRTITEILELNRSTRREEIARMLGGPQLTPKSLANASELLKLAVGGQKKSRERPARPFIKAQLGSPSR